MKRLLIVLSVLAVFSGCAVAPGPEPDPEKIRASVEFLKQETPSEIIIEKIPVFPEECGNKLCITNLEWKQLEFVITETRYKLALRHLAEESRTRFTNDLVNSLAEEMIAHAWATYRYNQLQTENDKLRTKATVTRIIDVLIFLSTFGIAAGIN